MNTEALPISGGTGPQGLAFRSDIQGMRALAVLTVLAYHLKVPFFAGGYVGVDAFLVISGYLITGHILREIGDHSFEGGRFYGRRIRRLLPASTLVFIVTTLAAAFFVSPVIVHRSIPEFVAAATFSVNALFAVKNTSYLASTSVPPLFQHYWSLALEEQFYLVWPWLILGLYRLTSFTDRSRVMFVTAMVLVTSCSFTLSIILTRSLQPTAFFLLPARMWEFGIGGLLAMTGAFIAGRRWRQVFGHIGALGFLSSCVLFDHRTAFPGYAAALPVASTALLLLVGFGESCGGPVDRLLRSAVAQFFGRISYSLYLWHWPPLVILQAAGRGQSWAARLSVAMACVGLAWVTERVVEQRWRTTIPPKRPRAGRVIPGSRDLSLLAALLVASGSAITFSYWWTGELDYGQAQAVTQPGEIPALLESSGGPVPSNVEPGLFDAGSSYPSIYRDGCHRGFRSIDSAPCVYGDDEAGMAVALFGDSHAAQWFPGLDENLRGTGVKLLVFTKSGCPSVEVEVFDPRLGREYTECHAWRQGVVQRLLDDPPDRVVLSNYAAPFEPHEWAQGLEVSLGLLAELPTLVIGQTPDLDANTPACLGTEIRSASRCSTSRSEAVDDEISQIEQRAAEAFGADFVDPTQWLCTLERCPAIAGTIVLYSDDHHLTVAASVALAPQLRSLTPSN